MVPFKTTSVNTHQNKWKTIQRRWPLYYTKYIGNDTKKIMILYPIWLEGFPQLQVCHAPWQKHAQSVLKDLGSQLAHVSWRGPLFQPHCFQTMMIYACHRFCEAISHKNCRHLLDLSAPVRLPMFSAHKAVLVKQGIYMGVNGEHATVPVDSGLC